jgi:hypothetical protein
VRIPIPVVILLVLAVVGGVWWGNTRNIDFMTPPSEARLSQVRARVEASFPRPEVVEEAVPVVEEPEPPPVVEPPKPPVDLGDLTAAPRLQDYGERSPQGATPLMELAAALEEKGEFQRALLAWERVLDLTKADDNQAATALSAIRRLRPTLPDWNAKPETAIAMTLHAGTGKKLAKSLAPILEEAARDLEKASAGIVKVKSQVTTGKTSAKGATPVALWFAGPDRKSVSTEVLSFTIEKPDALRDEVMKTIYELIRTHLARTTAYTPPAVPAEGEPVRDALGTRITRLSWSEFATGLNLPPKKEE